ncbi:MAG: PD-(D/E)XK nuclease family protein [Aggregatilineales bacterium]
MPNPRFRIPHYALFGRTATVIMPLDLHFSQSSLQDYLDCSYRFRMRYVERQLWPAVEAEPPQTMESQIRSGEAFHRLIHRHLAGIPAEKLSSLVEKEPLRQWWEAYLQTGLRDLPPMHYPEITLAAQIAGEWLIAKYDLIAIEPGRRAVIVDWKTSRQPQRAQLAWSIQTTVYRYILSVAGAHLNNNAPLQPEQIEMRYWFAKTPNQPERLFYDSAQQQLDGDTLSALIKNIIESKPDDFQRTGNTGHCRFCIYRSLCARGVSAGDFAAWADGDLAERENARNAAVGFDQVAEIEF